MDVERTSVRNTVEEVVDVAVEVPVEVAAAVVVEPHLGMIEEDHAWTLAEITGLAGQDMVAGKKEGVVTVVEVASRNPARI